MHIIVIVTLQFFTRCYKMMKSPNLSYTKIIYMFLKSALLYKILHKNFIFLSMYIERNSKKKDLKRDILNKSIFQYIKSNKKSNKYHWELNTYSSISTRWISFNVSKLILSFISTPSLPCLVHNWEIKHYNFFFIFPLILALYYIYVCVIFVRQDERNCKCMLENPRLPLMIFVVEDTKQ